MPPRKPPTATGGQEIPDFEPWLGESQGKTPKPRLKLQREPSTQAVKDLTGAYLQRAEAKAATAARREAAGFEPWLGEAETYPSRIPAAERDAVGEALEQIDNLPDRVIPLKSRKRFPTLTQYDTQLAKAKQAVTDARGRLKALNKVSGIDVGRRITQAEKDLANAVKQRKVALGAMHEAEIRVAIDDIVQRAKAAGGDAQAVEMVRQAYEDAVRLVPKAEGLLEAGALRQHLARLQASLEGTPPGVVGQLAAQRAVLQEALRLRTAEVVAPMAKQLDDAIAKELPKITYVGPSKWAKLLEPYKAKILIQHPEYYKGMSPELMRLMNQAQVYQRSKLAIAEAMGYPIKAIEGPYLEQMWELPRSVLETPVPRIPGKVSIARERLFGDYIEGLVAKAKPADVTVGELIEHSSNLMDQAIADAMMRRQVLQRFGTRVQKPVMSGYRRFGHPMYQGWYGPSPIANFVDQLYAPAGPTSKALANLSAAVKNSVFGIGDVAVFGVNILDAMTTGGPRMVAGLINRSLAMLHLPHVNVTMGENLPRVVRFAMDGLHQGMGPSAVTLKGGTVLKYIPYVGKYVDMPVNKVIDELARIQFGMILTPVRNMLHEGTLVTLHLLGEDTTHPLIRRMSADWNNAWTGASRGALRPGRRAAETVGLTSFQMTRAEGARLMQIAKALGPNATRPERLMAAMTLASFGASVYGLGSAINMAFGNGPIEFNPAKGDWATIKVGGQHVALVQRASLIRAIGKSFDILQNEPVADLALVWAQVTGAKVSPLGQIPGAAAGFGFEPRGGYQAGTLSAKGRLLNMAPMPPTVETMLTEPESRGPLPMALTATGVRSWPMSPWEHLNELVPGWGGMTNGQREIEAQKDPEVRKWWDKQLAQGVERGQESAITQQQKLEEFAEFGDSLVTAYNDPNSLRSDITNSYQDKLAENAAKSELRYAGIEFKEDTPERKALGAWYDTYDLLPDVPTDAHRQAMYDAQDTLLEQYPNLPTLITQNHQALFRGNAEAQAIVAEIDAARLVYKEYNKMPRKAVMDEEEQKAIYPLVQRAQAEAVYSELTTRQILKMWAIDGEIDDLQLFDALFYLKAKSNPDREIFRMDYAEELKWFEAVPVKDREPVLVGVE
jgi:hypothetical protein